MMRVHMYAFLVLAATAFPYGLAQADVIDSQTDDSVEATEPTVGPAYYVMAAYHPTRAGSIAGARFLINQSGDYLCPSEISAYEFSGTSTPTALNVSGGLGTTIGVLSNFDGTTTPDGKGNCDYSALDKYGRNPSFLVFPDRSYVLLLDTGWRNGQWSSLNGSPAISTTTSLFGFKPAFGPNIEWGTTGLESPYFQFFDTPPPLTPVAPVDPCANGGCISNVLFLPGIEASRLYEGTGCGGSAEERLWEPVGESVVKILQGSGDEKVKKLLLDSVGESICSDIYTKPSDILDAAGSSHLYTSFIEMMNQLKSEGMQDWKPISYDWRLSIPDLLTKGTERDGKIYYEEATTTPYIEQTLRSLAASSKTGKVTIIAHSNGGLIAKALLSRLGNDVSQSLVDQVILVGVPQSGAPLALGALLYGYNQGISKVVKILSTGVARQLANNAPMAYHLLPSQDYFDAVSDDVAHPVGRFAGSGYEEERSAYGPTLTAAADLGSFVLAKEGGRSKPEPADTDSAEVGVEGLMAYATAEHSTIDPWIPPDGIKVSEIAGWGIDTVAGVDFYTLNGARKYRPIFTEDGDGTVPVPSALMMASSPNISKYWMNLNKFNRNESQDIAHKDLFEIVSLEDFIKSALTRGVETLPNYFSETQPSPLSDNKTLMFILHSPLTLQLVDSRGNVTGLSNDDSILETIPNSSYGEFGDAKYITAPEGNTYDLVLNGQATGIFSLDLLESSGGTVIASSTIADVPTTATTVAHLKILNGLDTASPLLVDLGIGEEKISIQPVIGATVRYEATLIPEPTPIRKGISTGSISIPIESIQLATGTINVGTSSIPSFKGTPIHLQIEQAKPSYVVAAQKKSVVQPQPATVAYSASQQTILNRVVKTLYNKMYGIWMAIKNFAKLR